jgi:hypothetical protein
MAGPEVFVLTEFECTFVGVQTPTAKYKDEFVGCKCIDGKINMIFLFFNKKNVSTQNTI